MNVLQVQKKVLYRQTLRIKQTFIVKNLKPAVVKVYDYYQTSKSKLLSTQLFIRV